MALSDAYHGETLGALAVGGESCSAECFEPVEKVFNDYGEEV